MFNKLTSFRISDYGERENCIAYLVTEKADVCDDFSSRQAPKHLGILALSKCLAKFKERLNKQNDTNGLPFVKSKRYVFSISHKNGVSVAVLCQKTDGIKAVGIDIEHDRTTHEKIGLKVFPKQSERELAAAQGYSAIRAFSAKEAAYKALYPAYKNLAVFADFTLIEAGPSGCILKFNRAHLPTIKIIQDSFPGYVLSFCLIDS